jgi:hypothetical protein
MNAMVWTSLHLKWLINTEERLTTIDGKTVEVWEFRHENDEEILSAWAKHFRNHYCLDCEIDNLRQGYGYSRAEYLTNIKYPDAKTAPGPSIRAGDFGEILVADYLQYILEYWVPRTGYCDKYVRNESRKGCDVIGFKFLNDGQESPEDILAIFEAKTQFSGTKSKPRLQDAVNDSKKDPIRRGESLNAIKQRLSRAGSIDAAHRVERFQNTEDKPYRELSGAAALFSTKVFDPVDIGKTAVGNHPNSENLILFVVRGEAMMQLVHELYKRSADEA